MHCPESPPKVRYRGGILYVRNDLNPLEVTIKSYFADQIWHQVKINDVMLY